MEYHWRVGVACTSKFLKLNSIGTVWVDVEFMLADDMNPGDSLAPSGKHQHHSRFANQCLWDWHDHHAIDQHTLAK